MKHIQLTFRYDYLGRRVEKQVSTWSGTAWTVTQTRRYVWDGWRMRLEMDGSRKTPKAMEGWGEKNRMSRFSSDRGWLCASILCFVCACALLFCWVRSHRVNRDEDAFAWTPSSSVLIYVGSVDGYVRAGYLHCPNIRSVGPPLKVAKSCGLFITAGPLPDSVPTLNPRKLSFLRREVDWGSYPPFGVIGIAISYRLLVLVFTTLGIMPIAVAGFRVRRRSRRGRCTACGYDLRGSPSGVCPECEKPARTASDEDVRE